MNWKFWKKKKESEEPQFTHAKDCRDCRRELKAELKEKMMKEEADKKKEGGVVDGKK